MKTIRNGAQDGSLDSPVSIFLRFLKFGALAWGGPAAQIAMIKHECVDLEGWVSEESFKKTLAVFQILPGPEAHELCEQDEDTWVALSPEVPDWTVVADTYEEAHRLAEEGVRFALDRDNVDRKHFVPAPAA